MDDASEFINVFKLCGLDQMTNATREGEVTTVVDRGLGRKVVLVTGNVPAANFVRVPKIGKPPLGLTGRYVYAQVKLDPERFYAVHVDCLCSDPTAKSAAATGFTVGRTTVRLSCSNLYKRKSSRPDPAGAAATTLSGSAVNFVHEPPARKWHVLVFDAHGLVRRVQTPDAGARSRGGPNASKEPPRFDCVKSIQLGGGCAVRNVFISDTLYDADTLPKEMHLSSKPGVDVAWHRVGGVDPNPAKEGRSKRGGAIDPLAPPRTGPTNKAIPPDDAADDDAELPTSAPIVAVPHATNMSTTPYATHDDATIEARRATPRERRPIFDDETAKTNEKKTSNAARPSSPPLVGHEDASLDQPPSPPARGGAARASSARDVGRGKPRAARPASSRVNAPSDGAHPSDVGFFGDGGAGGLRSSSRPVSGAVSDVDALTGMPYAMEGARAPFAGARAGAEDAPPALTLTRAVGLTGEFPGAVAWCPDGNTVAYPVNSLVALHDVRTGAQHHLFGHTDRVHLTCFSRDGRVLVTGQRGRHPLVKVWDVAERGAQVATLYAHASGLKSLDVSPCGRAVVAAGTDTSGRQMIAVWDIGRAMRGGFAPMTLRHRTDYHVNCVKFSPFEEDHVVTCGKNSIRTYRLRKGQLRGCSVDLGDLKLSKLAPKSTQFNRRDDFELNDFTSLAFEIGYGVSDLNQKKVFVATVTGAVVQVNYGKRQLERVFQLHDDRINDLRVSEGFAVTASDDGFLRVWPTDFSDFFLEAEHESAVTSCSVSADGLQVAAATRTGSLGVMDIPSHAYRTLLRSHAGAVTGVAFDPDPDRDEMATCSEDGTARVWDCATGEQLYEFAGDAGECARAVAYRPGGHGVGVHGKNRSEASGRALAVGFGGGVSRVFDVETTATLAQHRQHKGDVVAVQFTPDGSRMITAGAEGNLCVYDAKNGYLPVKYLATALPTDRVRAAISPDGKLLATIGPNGETVLTFDVETLKLRSPALVPPRLVRTGGRSKVLAFAFTPDGSSLVVANDDDSVSRHSCADEHGDGAPHAVGRSLCAGVDAVAVDATGTLAVLGGRDKSLVAAPLAGLREPFAPAECLSNVPSQAYGAHWGAVRAVAFDSRGARCASVGDGDAVYVWSVDARAGKALSANRARDRVSFDVGPDTRGRVEDADAGDSDDAGSIPGGIDGDAEPGEGDAFTHKPKLAATPGRERGILKKRPTPAKSALKTDGKYGGGGGGGEDEDARVEEPAVDDEDELEAEDVDADVPVPNEDRPEPPVEPVDAGSRKVTQRSRTGAPPGKKPVAIRPARVIGLSTGAAAAGNESTESAAAVAAATAAAPAIYVPELGSTLFAAGCDVVIERVGGERQQALLRRHPFPITALAHHPETRRIASASASDVGRFDADGPGECVVCVWDASTGACLRELVHSRAGGCVVSLQFSPEGALLLSAGADPDGALRVWDVATGARVLAAAADAPVAAAGWCTHSPRAEFFTAGADGAWLHSLQDETGTTGSHTVAKIAFDDDDDYHDDDRASGETRVPKRGFTGASPVCTAASTASDGSLFVGDSRGRVWRSPMRVGLETNGGAVPTLAKCCDALPAGEAVTAVRALPGGRLFVGGARRARVWINALSGVGWEEVGELELDGAVVAANFDAGSSGRRGATGSNPSPNPKPEPWGVVTTSAGSAWLVEIATGTARALVQAHPLDVAHCRVETLGHRTALATTSVDGTARVWDCAAGAKVLEVHADVSARGTRATRAVTSPDGTRLCMGCGDGGVAVVVVGAGVGGAAPGVQGPVRHARAHPSGAAVVHASFLRTTTASFASDDRRTTVGQPSEPVPRLLTVAADGSISLTDVVRCESSQLFPGLSNADAASDPVVAAAASEPAVGAGEVLVALARASSLQTVSVAVGTKSELRSTFKPTPRGTYVTAPGMCAWSETRRGVCYYASRATGGRLVQFDATRGEAIAVVDCDAGAGVGGPWCVAVTERAGMDALAVGTARGVEFLSVNADGVVSGGVSGKERSGTCAMSNGARHVAWTEDGADAWVCSGTCAYLIADPFGQLESNR